MTSTSNSPAFGTVRGTVKGLLNGKGIFAVLVVLLVIAAVIAPNFYAPSNIDNTLRRASILGIITVGQFIVLLVRGVDLSVAAMVGITVVAVTSSSNIGVGLAIAFAIAVAVGLVNAWLVVGRAVPAFVATFGMALVLGGAQLLWTRGAVSAESPAVLTAIARISLGPIPLPVVLWVGLTAIGVVWIRRTVSGRNLVLAGANPKMAALSGVGVGGKQVVAFVVAALLAVIGGTLLTGYSGYVDQSTGKGLELDSITAALLGGARFRGGEGSLVSALGGVLVLNVLATLIVVLGLPPQVQFIVKGVVLVLALTLHWPRRKRPRP